MLMQKISNIVEHLRRRFDGKSVSQTEAEFLPGILEVTEKPPSPAGRLILWTIIFFILELMVWSFTGSIDEVAVATGKLVPTGHVKLVQAEDKGVVKGIYIKEGDIVQKGQLLIELDTTFSAADIARVQKDVAYCQMEIERLLAEKEGRPFVAQVYPGVDAKDRELQQQLYNSRQERHRTKLAVAQEAVVQNAATLESARSVQAKYLSLYQIAKDKEERIQQLVHENAISQFVLLDHRSRRIELEQSLYAQMADTNRAEAQLAQSRLSLNSIIAEREQEISISLVESRNKLLSYTEELKKAEEKKRLANIVSPIEGKVHQLSIHTLGGVVSPAQALMMIVPDGAGLEVEAFISNKDVGFVRTGQSAEIKIESFSFQKFGTVQAKLKEISPDAVEDSEKRLVYRSIFELDSDHIIVNGQTVYLSPGMAVSAEIKTGSKRIIDFFMDPFRKYKTESLRER